ncbi:hypothetical protein B0H15DRAFT_329177 [Mycena belliarum]|uniref:Uncharacterized protein n=1 Tax=Mycena belliarum TaxID=1033014 RepID=A0AAD6XVI2_9AGAR|nr:hypothetical protein B0H15DRAFT_329177 [Mycena belliae]
MESSTTTTELRVALCLLARTDASAAGRRPHPTLLECHTHILSSQTRVFFSSFRPTACRAFLSAVNPGNWLLVSTSSRTPSPVLRKPASRPGARTRRFWTTVNSPGNRLIDSDILALHSVLRLQQARVPPRRPSSKTLDHGQPPGKRLIDSDILALHSVLRLLRFASRPGARSRRFWTTVNPRQTANRYGHPPTSPRPLSSPIRVPSRRASTKTLGPGTMPSRSTSSANGNSYSTPAIFLDYLLATSRFPSQYLPSFPSNLNPIPLPHPIQNPSANSISRYLSLSLSLFIFLLYLGGARAYLRVYIQTRT